MIKILQKEAKVLRQKSRDLHIASITSPKIQKLIGALSQALAKEDDGVAIAAPQLGASLSIFVVSGKVFDLIKERQPKPEIGRADLVCVNPKLVKSSRKKQWMDEGCLSVRWLYGRVERAEKVRLRAHDAKGKVFEMGASGLLSQIFQHEMDHLQGVLFTDKAQNVTEIPPKEVKSRKSKV